MVSDEKYQILDDKKTIKLPVMIHMTPQHHPVYIDRKVYLASDIESALEHLVNNFPHELQQPLQKRIYESFPALYKQGGNYNGKKTE